MPRAMTKKNIEMLEWALSKVESVNYKVSLRWVFYRLFQAGLYQNKTSYGAFVQMLSRARHQYRYGWHPATLADDVRQRIGRCQGLETIDEWIDYYSTEYIDKVTFEFDHFYQQKRYVEIWFEARAMAGQFEFYTKKIDLIPFGGDPSIPFKWEIAKSLETNYSYYGKPITVLYFGDLDQKGNEIYTTAVKHIRKWCEIDFDIEWCGLTQEQVEKYGLPENPGKPGQYQWEALEDGPAKEIITNALSDHIDLDLMDETNSEAKEQEGKLKRKLKDAMDTYRKS